MATRSVVSYDDITLSYDQPELPFHQANSSQPPPKKRRKNNQKAKHWDDRRTNQKNVPNSQRAELLNSTNNSSSTQKQSESQEEEQEWEAEGEYEEDKSRELTHQEIWDDSALVDAWDSAMEEYRAYNGTENDWKNEPVKKSPLWYNIPVDPSKKSVDVPSTNITADVVAGPFLPVEAKTEDTEDSQPINFDTFVPTHDASLDSGETPQAVPPMNYVPDAPAGPMVSQDEAFSRALSAMYWGGYWTAMYHAQRHYAPTSAPATEITALDPVAEGEHPEDDDDEEDEDIQIDEDDGEFVSTQR